jgi:hypothetical protein
VWTEIPLAEIGGVLLAIPGMSDNSFIVIALNVSDSFGYLPKWVWEWLRKDRTGRSSLKPPPVPPSLPFFNDK